MNFVRVAVNHSTNKVIAVMTSDVPFAAQRVYTPGQECEMVDLGVIEGEAWEKLDGTPCSLHLYLLERLENVEGPPPRIAKIHDVPCTLDGIKQRLRRSGPSGIPVRVRAWLTRILPPDEVEACGIGMGLPLSAIASAEVLRNKRDPGSGSVLPLIQQRIAKVGAGRLARRCARRANAIARERATATAAEEAWQEHLRVVGANLAPSETR